MFFVTYPSPIRIIEPIETYSLENDWRYRTVYIIDFSREYMIKWCKDLNMPNQLTENQEFLRINRGGVQMKKKLSFLVTALFVVTVLFSTVSSSEVKKVEKKAEVKKIGVKSTEVKTGVVKTLVAAKKTVIKKDGVKIEVKKEAKKTEVAPKYFVSRKDIKDLGKRIEALKKVIYSKSMLTRRQEKENSVACVSAPAVVEEKSGKIGGEIYFGNDTTTNNYDIQRAYLTYTDKFGSTASMRVTLDVARQNSIQPLGSILKYAYVEMPVDISSLDIPVSLSVKLGLQQTAWIDYAAKIWGNAYLSRVFVDNEGLMPAADFGVGTTGKMNIAGLPEMEYAATLTNGSGYRSMDTNTAKDFGVRLNSDICKDEAGTTLKLGVYGNWKNQFVITDNNSKNAGAMLAFVNKKWGTIYGEYLRGTNLTGYSVGGFMYLFADSSNFMSSYSIIGRIDRFDPSMSTANDDISRNVLGVSYDWGTNIKLAYDYQTSQIGAGSQSSKYSFHSLITF